MSRLERKATKGNVLHAMIRTAAAQLAARGVSVAAEFLQEIALVQAGL
jgi:hypothetical protein